MQSSYQKVSQADLVLLPTTQKMLMRLHRPATLIPYLRDSRRWMNLRKKFCDSSILLWEMGGSQSRNKHLLRH